MGVPSDRGSRADGPPRDFVGYGAVPPVVHWPHGARVAVSLVVNYEAGAEYSYEAGDQRRETVGEFGFAINPTRLGVPDLCIESTFEYESRAGTWRLARILDEYGVPATFNCCGRALDHNPEIGAYISAAGHEAMAHGWRWEDAWRLSREQERELIERAVRSIESACGARPVGWHSRCTPSSQTRELIVAEGGFLYDSDAYNDDLPYFVEIRGSRHLVVPYSLTFNDMRFAFPGYADPMSFFTYLKMGLDDLWDEGATHPKMMTIGVHGRWAGQPGRARALRDFIDYARGKGQIWFARRSDIAQWWLDHHDEFRRQP
jgi:peptidoglycan/xylan/chitin deacetylase (PgdA/CDA1 family)